MKKIDLRRPEGDKPADFQGLRGDAQRRDGSGPHAAYHADKFPGMHNSDSHLSTTEDYR